LTDYDRLKTRIIIARSIGENPDYVRIISTKSEDSKFKRTLYALDDYKGYNLCLGFSKVPTIEEAREKVKDIYLAGIELDFDEEMGSI
jgi:hypothetical protein